MVFVVDPSKEGLGKVLKPWEEIAMRYVWASTQLSRMPAVSYVQVGSRDVYYQVNKELEEQGESISRASVINFLNRMVDEDVLDVEFETCKGGKKGMYAPKLDESGFKKKVARDVIESLLGDFEDETLSALEELVTPSVLEAILRKR